MSIAQAEESITQMRTCMLASSGTIGVFFIAFLAYTFFGRAHVDKLARDFVTAKTIRYSAPLVELAESALKSDVIGKLITGEQRRIADTEIAEYRADPDDYIGKLTGKAVVAVDNQPGNPLLVKVISWKLGIHNYYYRVLERLLVDLRGYPK